MISTVLAAANAYTGNTTVAVDCTAYGMLPIPAAYSVKLSE